MFLTSIVKVLPEALRHPAGLAMVGSFAFHGFLFAGGIPLMSGDSDAVDSKRLVSLIKLSPAEQGRLPQAASSQVAPLPPAPADLSSFVLPPMAQLPDVGQQPELFDLPSPSLPATPNLPSSALGSIPSLGSAPPIRISPGRPLPFITPNQIPSQPAEDPSPFSSPDSETQPQPNVPEPTLPDVAASPPISDFPENSPSPSDQQIDLSVKDVFKDEPSSEQSVPDASGTSNDLDNLNQLIAKAREISGDPNLKPENISITPTYPKAACDDRPKGFAIVGAIVRPNGELAEAPTLQGSSGSKILDDAALDTVSKYQFKPSGKYQAFFPTLQFEYSEAACAEDTTSPSSSPSESSTTNDQSSSSDQSSTNVNQLTVARQKYDSNLKQRPVAIDYDYPEAACEGQLKGQPQVTATVKPNGELVEQPTVTKSTGQAILNTAAVNAMAKHSFPATGKFEAYVFSPSFVYSEAACSEAEESESSVEDSEKPTPKSSPESSGSSKSSKSSVDSDSSSLKKSNQPTSTSSPKSSEGATSQPSEDSGQEATSEEAESPESNEAPTQESPDSEETAPE